MPRVSVILASYNAEAFIRAAVDSILAQTFTDFEFIIVDDGSTDQSRAILHGYDDPRIRLIEQDNIGLTPTLNKACKLATGDLLARMDADDVAKPDRFAKQVAFLDAHPEVAVLGGAYELVDDRGRLLRVQHQPTDNATLQELCLVGKVPICHPLVMMRRGVFEQVGGYDESYSASQDLDLWLRMGEHGDLASLPDVLLQYRMQADSISEKKGALQTECMRRGCEAAWERRGVIGKYTFANPTGWRPTNATESKLKYALQYGWWAWHSGEWRTALSYGKDAVKLSPTSTDGWKLVACALMKRKSA
ncbi:MAG: glycosyltransferase [Planctomycetota bacterium]